MGSKVLNARYEHSVNTDAVEIMEVVKGSVMNASAGQNTSRSTWYICLESRLRENGGKLGGGRSLKNIYITRLSKVLARKRVSYLPDGVEPLEEHR